MSLLSLLAEAALCVIDTDRKEDMTTATTTTDSDKSPRRASLASRSASSCSPTHSHACSTTDRELVVGEPDEWSHNADKPQLSSQKAGIVLPPAVISDNQQRNKHGRRYQCEVCSKLFQRKHHLVSHLVSHTESKPFRCAIPGCDASFRRTQDMRRHMRKVFHKPVDLPHVDGDFKIPVQDTLSVPLLPPSADHHDAALYSHSA
ncbi:hypothetical protein CcCBS67573_g03505 [Chytriomyces confervae]|uniref:C2H2-type domain-containing protein n=1 Tax=Chytriomyces confervae TaxID=246404 RepID=A0A507FGG5_9FUNG|nr:hypothetical protein HDU80_002930 [Chytriomyces hyalinus]TPX75242.1 hypothetical protein CcCBS67573_g03505 [Chytriomyces confervae]